MSNTTTRSMTKEVKEGKTNDPENVQPPPCPQVGRSENTDPLTMSVMSQFAAHWESFTSGFAADMEKLVKTVGDAKGGLVKKVADLEKALATTTASNTQLETQLKVLSTKYDLLTQKFDKVVSISPEGLATLKSTDFLDLQEEFISSQ